jgi:hypothetical protein
MDIMRKILINLRIYSLLLGILMIAACGPGASDPIQTPIESNIPSASTSIPAGETPTAIDTENEAEIMPKPLFNKTELPFAAEALVDLAKQRLVSKYGMHIDKIMLLSVTPMDWPDASLGCPREGMDYAEVSTPGYQILLQYGITVYTFHTDTTEHVVLCQERPPDNIFIEP